MNIDYTVLPALLGILAVFTMTFCVRRLRSLGGRTYSRVGRLIERSALLLAFLLFLFVAGSSLFNAADLRLFSHAHPPSGQVLMVGQYRMHIHCAGSGSPTLVLEAGLGDDALIWAGLQQKLAQTTKVCAYDRAGFGWSDTRPGPRDADHIASELQALLTQAGVSGPILLMGHSIGGLYIRDYASHYPAQVQGLIFIDSSSPLQNKNPAFVAGGSSGPPAWLIRAAMVVGVPRVLGMCSGGKDDAGHPLSEERAEDLCGLHYDSISAEAGNFDHSGEQALRLRNCGSTPVLVLSHDPARLLQDRHDAKDIAKQEAWSGMQEELKRLSTNSKRIIAAGSTHYVMLDRPELIEKEVSLFIEDVRHARPVTTPGGATVRE